MHAPTRSAGIDRLLQHPQKLLAAFGVLVVIVVGLAAYAQSPMVLLPLLLLVAAGIAVQSNIQVAILLLLAVLPFSHEVRLGTKLSLDIPSEPLMLLLLAMVIVGALRGQLGNTRWLVHPITGLIVLQLGWALFSAFYSVNPLHSVKYLLAKLWYLASFYVAAGTIVRQPADVRKIVWAFLPPLLLTIGWATLRHLSKGLAFHAVGWAIHPFYLNHVIYAATLALFMPFALFGATLTGTGRSWVGRWFWRGALLAVMVGVTLAYTRASWLAVVMAGGYYVVLRWRLVRPMLITLFAGILLLVGWLVTDHNYLRFAPDFEKTTWHGHDLAAHLRSTVKLQDVSAMERVYRWVAAARMVPESPIVGHGPSTFYPEYKKYADRRFITYVSVNYEQSTTHNYFLLQLVEQGVPGFLLFVAVVWWGLVLPQRLYHRTRNRRLRAIVLAAGMSICITVFHLTLNELIEVDKIGSFWFICLMLLAKAESWIREEEEAAAAGQVA